MEGEYCVYRHTSPSGKVYIGITMLVPTARWKRGNGYSFNPYFTNAIKKYGWDNIKHEIIETGLTREEANLAEIRHIELHKSANKIYGYNCSLGGGTHSKETRALIASGVTRAWGNEQIRQKYTLALQRASNTDEHRALVSFLAKKRYESPEARKAQSIVAKKRYSVPEAKKQASDIARQRWENPETRKLYVEGLKKRPRRAKKVYCIELETIFDSAREANRIIGANIIGIRENCNKRAHPKTCGGYHWEWYSEPLKQGAPTP